MKNFILAASLLAAIQGSPAQTNQPPQSNFRESLVRLAAHSADPCAASSGIDTDDPDESALFEQTMKSVVERLNANGASAPVQRVTDSLNEIEATSRRVNAGWPDENRFHFQVLDLPPIIVVKLSIRETAHFLVLAIPLNSDNGKANSLWRQVGEDDTFLEHPSTGSSVDLYPLHRGRSGDARFLARIARFGCAGSIGITYDAREWSPEPFAELLQIIEQSGSLGMAQAADGLGPTLKDPFHPIGILQTKGTRITLPYCWFSTIDTWDNPSLCAADSYDLSSNTVTFVSRIFNRPDLVPIAKAFEYAQKHDYPAVLGYCASPAVARKLVKEAIVPVSADDLRVIRLGTDRERVEMGDLGSYRLDLQKFNGVWKIVAFTE